MCGIWLYLIKENEKVEDLSNIINKSYSLNGRGPDNYSFNYLNNKFMIGFHRLAIMDLSNKGNQPFTYFNNNEEYYCVCNGEIYNAKYIKDNLIDDYKFKSSSDCEVLIPLYLKYGKDMLQLLDGVFTFAIIKLNGDKYDVFSARDRIGVRPGFIGYNSETGSICISSEIKGISGLFDKIDIFKPGQYLSFNNTKDTKFNFEEYYLYDYKFGLKDHNINNMINKLLTESVEKRLISDRPVCALLSGGLDSSLVCSIASKILKSRGQKLYTFSIGMKNSPDTYYADKVAKYIDSVHTVVRISNEEALDAITNVIYSTETYDITTIRASVGQYLISKYISENSDFKVVLSGDGSDEVTSGYLYNFNAPTPYDLHIDAVKRVKEIHLYDSLRADRATSIHGLELRVPFLDSKFVDYYLSIEPKLRQPTKERMEKYLLRQSFEGYLPSEVLWRQKEAFSDGISSEDDSWFTTIQKYISTKISDKELDDSKKIYSYCSPTTKESLYYRNIFCKLFDNKYCNIIPRFWMPMWTDTNDPSARTIKNIYKNSDKLIKNI